MHPHFGRKYFGIVGATVAQNRCTTSGGAISMAEGKLLLPASHLRVLSKLKRTAVSEGRRRLVEGGRPETNSERGTNGGAGTPVARRHLHLIAGHFYPLIKILNLLNRI